MPTSIEISVPDIGDFSDIEVIEVLVRPGDRIELEQPLVTLESDKASMDIPATHAGVVKQVHVSVGDRVSEGNPIIELELEQGAAAQSEPAAAADVAPNEDSKAAAAEPEGDDTVEFFDLGDEKRDTQAAEERVDVVVLGAGPGGYTAAFRAADLGLRTVLVEQHQSLGGVCLNVGCIPSKALLHTAEVITATREMAAHGLSFAKPDIDLEKLAGWKDSVVGQLTKGLAGLARQRGVQVITGTGKFQSPHTLSVQTENGSETLAFEQAIIAVGSEPVSLPAFPNDDPRLWDSTDALALSTIPETLLVIGGGIIGLEMACVYSALGTRVTVVELLDGLMPGADRDLVRPLQKRLEGQYEAIYVGTKVISLQAANEGLMAGFEGADAPASAVYDRVLVAVGRTPNGNKIDAQAAGVQVDERGFIAVDRQQRTNVPHIFAIGDVTGQPMLAHKATHEGKVAAEVAAGHKSGFDAICIPSVAYTDPEVAWVGLTEDDAKRDKIAFDKGSFPWAASGRSLGMGRSEGLTKLLYDRESGRLLGAGIVGPHAGDLIAEAALAIELGADAQDMALTIHPHPTLSETLSFAAEVAEGTITDLYLPKRRR